MISEEEYIKEFGSRWRSEVNFTSSDSMDYLFGIEYPFDILSYNKGFGLPRIDDPKSRVRWYIQWEMLTENKIKIPSYEPRKLDRTI